VGKSAWAADHREPDYPDYGSLFPSSSANGGNAAKAASNFFEFGHCVSVDGLASHRHASGYPNRGTPVGIRSGVLSHFAH
jgi:hypothetical protein